MSHNMVLLQNNLQTNPHQHFLFVCWVNKTRAVKPLGRSFSRILSFTQDGPAFSTKTAKRALQVQLRSAIYKLLYVTICRYVSCCHSEECLFVCWVNKTRAVKPLRSFHSWILSFTLDGPAFSTKTARRALQFQLRSALSTS